MQGAIALQKGLGAVHSLSHALGGLWVRPHHRTLDAVLKPEVLKFNESAALDKVCQIATVFGRADAAVLAKGFASSRARSHFQRVSARSEFSQTSLAQ